METTVRHPEFAAKLKSARKRTGKSQERIALEVGTSRRHWIRWERGDHLPSGEFLAKIGEATGQPEAFAEFIESDEDDEEDLASFLISALRSYRATSKHEPAVKA